MSSQRFSVPASMTIGGREFAWGRRTYLMGILNVTPDSFSGDGVGCDVAAAMRRAQQLEAEGADLIDVGGESTRPGHTPVPQQAELRRVLPALRAVCSAVSVPVSIDTRKATVARAAIEAGAALVNDVSGLMDDAEMAAVVKESGVPVVLMARGASRRADPLARVRADLAESLRRAAQHGIPPERLIVDPGFGFGLDWLGNLAVLRRLRLLRGYGLPLLVGLSRKSTIRRVLGDEPPYRVPANAALTALSIAGGADIVRVHDMAAMRAAARMADAVVRGPVENLTPLIPFPLREGDDPSAR
jgi:dihydropteroate synthase